MASSSSPEARPGTPPRWQACRRRLLKAALALLLAVLLAAAGLWLLVALVPFDPDSLFSGEVSTILLDRNGRALRPFLGSDERWRIPVQLSEISPWLIKATLAVEDKRFYSHKGIDLVAVCRAALSNVHRQRVVSGASTLTMQVAALNDTTDHTIGRKLRQAFRGLQLEYHRSKQEILELYFTNAPYGGNICGAEAAARRYFAKSASELSLAEAALLAGVPQSPSRLRPDRNLPSAMRRRTHVLKRMLACGMITPSDCERALRTTPHVGTHTPPAEAPHFCNFVHQLYPRASRMRTTLDLSLQHEAEQLLRAQLSRLASREVTNGALVVLDNASAGVLAMVGSVDFQSVQIDGQVNGALAARSPGSTLKPFIYALAFDQQVLTPATVLCDVPQQYPGYDPQNFDKQFRGLVAAEKALAWSLNIPAIDVLQQVGVARTVRFLRNAGIDTLTDSPDEYGLSLAIGSCGVRLLDLANAYAMLARGGFYRPYRLLLDQAPDSQAAFSTSSLSARPMRPAGETLSSSTASLSASKRRSQPPASATLASAKLSQPSARRLLTTGACYGVTRALSNPELRAPEGVAPELLGLQGVAWKTGTSSGFRDAWTVAYSRRYTVGVWVGNFDGRPSRALVGSEAAAPVALELMKRLHPGSSSQTLSPNWPVRPPEIGAVAVCSESGLLPSSDCPSTRTVEALLPKSKAQFARNYPVCQIHRSVRVDRETGELLCTRCMSGRLLDERVFSFWPPLVCAWLQRNGSSTALPPPHFRDCASASTSPAPRILSPKPDDSFIVSSSRPLDAQKLAFQAAVPPGTTRLYWFLDGELLESCAPETTVYFAPHAGQHTVRCVDEQGRSHSVTFRVESD